MDIITSSCAKGHSKPRLEENKPSGSTFPTSDMPATQQCVVSSQTDGSSSDVQVAENEELERVVNGEADQPDWENVVPPDLEGFWDKKKSDKRDSFDERMDSTLSQIELLIETLKNLHEDEYEDVLNMLETDGAPLLELIDACREEERRYNASPATWKPSQGPAMYFRPRLWEAGDAWSS